MVVSSSAVVAFKIFKVSMAQETVEVGGGAGLWRGKDGFLRCIVIKAS